MSLPRKFTVLACLAASASRPQSGPDIEQRVAALVRRMTVDEKIGQMSQSTDMATPLSDRIRQEIRDSRWGSFINAGSPAGKSSVRIIRLLN